jgi:Fe(3+) dicitrate transport protein
MDSSLPSQKQILMLKGWLIVVLFFPTALFAQQYTLSGNISCKKEPDAVKHLELILVETQQKTTADENGNFIFTAVDSGTYTLYLFKLGYHTISKTIVLNKHSVHNIELTALEQELGALTVKAKKDNEFGITRLHAIEGTNIYSGKKNEVIVMEDVNANLATNNSRQIFAKVPGLNIWENDGAGLQLGIGGRGLNPNRVSNFNTRQNGYDISADALGYPESYYSPPSEGIRQIEIVRGAASLQYGTQFGGLINFRMKKGPQDKVLELTSRQTVGSFGLFNSFNSVGGSKKKWNYYAFHQYKTGNGWRPNAQFKTHTTYVQLNHQFNKRLSMSAEYTHLSYIAHQPGGLTDALFEDNPRQSIRERNWFRVNWNLAALKFNYRLNEKAEFESMFFGLLAGRDALGYLGLISRSDPFQERDLLTDQYRNIGNETKYIQRYTLVDEHVSAFLIGSRYYRGHTKRKQGNASSGSDASFSYLNPNDLEHSSYVFPSNNIAIFAENIFQLSSKFSLTPGLRFETIFTSADGYFKEELRNRADSVIFSATYNDKRENERAFLLAGIGASYKPNNKVEYYANVSQNYRSINFNDMRIVNPNFRVDNNLKDESGYSADIGMRGNIKGLFNYDLSIFMIHYNDRIGEVLATDSTTFLPYRLRTNISDSKNYGVESFFEINLSRLFGFKNAKHLFFLFNNLSWMDARYLNSKEAAFENKKVELVAPLLLKSGISWKRKDLKISWQYAYTAEHFTDATNAEFTANAVNGMVPAYYIVDLSAQYQFKRLTFSAGLNNLTNNIYFTRRASGYPGPGIIPSDGRNFYLTAAIKL